MLNNLSAWTLPPDRIVFGFLSTLGRTAQLSWHCPFTFMITQARPVFVSLWAWAGNEHKPNLNSKSGSRTCRTKLDLSPSQTPAVGRWVPQSGGNQLRIWLRLHPYIHVIQRIHVIHVSMYPCILYLSATYLVQIGNSPRLADLLHG